jgi:hypothetical protein
VALPWQEEFQLGGDGRAVAQELVRAASGKIERRAPGSVTRGR